MPRGKSKPVAPTEAEETMTTGVHRRGACGGAHQLYWVEVGDLKGVTGLGSIRPNLHHRGGGIRSPGKI